MATESGYNNQKKYGNAQHKTIHSVGSDKFAAPSASKILYELNAIAAPIVDATVLDTDNKLVYVELTGHNARENDVLRMMDGNLEAWEFDIVEIIDANIFAIYNVGSLAGAQVLPAPGDNAKIMRWVTPKGDQEGNANFSPGPVQYVLDGVAVQVNEDTVTPANNKSLPVKFTVDINGVQSAIVRDDATPANNSPLPAGMYIFKDGVIYPVTKDTGTPGNTVAVPVEIVSASGTEINITAGDINIHTTDLGANFDSMRIGAGDGNYAAANASGEMLTHDQDALDELQTLNTVDFATEAKQDSQITLLSSIETSIQNIEGNTPTLGQKNSANSAPVVLSTEQEGILDGIDQNTLDTVTELQTLNTVDFATEAKQDSQITELQSINTELDSQTTIMNAQSTLIGAVNEAAPGTDTASSGLNGRLQRIAQRLSSLILLLPTSLGQKTAANSLAVVPASDYTPPAPSVPAALTLKHARVSLPTANTAVKITTDGLAPSATRRKLRFSVDPDDVTNNAKFYIGASTVVATSGATQGEQIFPGAPIMLENDVNDYYIVSDQNTQFFKVIEEE